MSYKRLAYAVMLAFPITIFTNYLFGTDEQMRLFVGVHSVLTYNRAGVLQSYELYYGTELMYATKASGEPKALLYYYANSYYPLLLCMMPMVIVLYIIIGLTHSRKGVNDTKHLA
jgi:hypothetical protein